MRKGLTEKQKMFVKEYLIDLNATQAAIRAGYSEDSARQIANETLTKPYIQEAIQKAQDKRAEKLDIDAEWVLREAVDAVKIFKADGNSALVSAINLVAKHRDIDAFAAEKSEVKQEVKQTINASNLSDETLKELLNAQNVKPD